MLAGGGIALAVGGSFGAGLGLLLALGGPGALARLEPAAAHRSRQRLAADLPGALDLLAACLAGGAAPGHAVRAVADAAAGVTGEVLGQVAAALEVGVPPEEAWQILSAADPDGAAGAAARALVRAARSGAPVAAAVQVVADDARRQAQHRAQEAAARAGVLAVAPLGLCFLPAFVLLGIVPVVAGLIGPALASL